MNDMLNSIGGKRLVAQVVTKDGDVVAMMADHARRLETAAMQTSAPPEAALGFGGPERRTVVDRVLLTGDAMSSHQAAVVFRALLMVALVVALVIATG